MALISLLSASQALVSEIQNKTNKTQQNDVVLGHVETLVSLDWGVSVWEGRLCGLVGIWGVYVCMCGKAMWHLLGSLAETLACPCRC